MVIFIVSVSSDDPIRLIVQMVLYSWNIQLLFGYVNIDVMLCW